MLKTTPLPKLFKTLQICDSGEYDSKSKARSLGSHGTHHRHRTQHRQASVFSQKPWNTMHYAVVSTTGATGKLSEVEMESGEVLYPGLSKEEGEALFTEAMAAISAITFHFSPQTLKTD